MRIGIVVLLLLGVAHAEERSIHFERLDVELEVKENRAVVATERIRVRFAGAWNGIDREIPVPPDGSVLSIHSVTDAGGVRLNSRVTRIDDHLRVRIRVPGAQDATHTVVLVYEITNAFRQDRHGLFLKWQIVGETWRAPIQSAQVTVRTTMDHPVRYRDSTGATTEAAKASDLRPVFRTPRPLALGETFAITMQLRTAGAARRSRSVPIGAMALLLLPLLPLAL